MAIEAGTQVGRFRVIKLLAQGGMAEVYRAEQELTTGIFRPAALKVIRQEYSESEDFREMFLDEARTACTLSHPNIVHIYEVGESDGLLYMGMELVAGESLGAVARALEERGQRLDDDAVVSIGLFACSALEAVHALKVSSPTTPAEQAVNLVHRDVSPQNLLLSPNGMVRLIDFGIAKAATNRNLTLPGMTKGKAGYFSPEQAIGKALDGRSDLFSLGVTLYKLAAGATPFDEHKTHQERQTALVTGRWMPLSEAAPTRLAGLHRIVAKSMQLQREDRYQNAEDMREELEALAYEAGLHVGQASLAGYVAEHDGEISIPDARKVSGPHLVRRRTLDQMPVQPPPPPRKRGLAVAFWGAVVAGGVAAVLFAPKQKAPDPQPAVEVAQMEATIEVAKGEPDAAVAAAEVEAPASSPALRSPPAEALALVAPRPPSRPRSTSTPVATNQRAARPPPELRSPPPEPPEVFKGQGKLSVGAFPEGSVVNVSIVGGAKIGDTPFQEKVNSGRYTLDIVGKDQGKHDRCEQVTVRENKTTRVKYDTTTGRCKVDES